MDHFQPQAPIHPLPLRPSMQSTASSTTCDPSQTSETNPTSLSSGVPQLPEEAKIKGHNSISCACAGATLRSNSGRQNLDLVGTGAQFDGHDTEAASTGVTRLGRDGAWLQDGLLWYRLTTDIYLRLPEEGQVHPMPTAGGRQRPSPTQQMSLFAFVMLTVLALSLMTFGLIWSNADHPVRRKGVLFGGLLALTIFLGGAMTAGGRSVMEVFTMASLVVTTGTLVQGLWFSGSNQV